VETGAGFRGGGVCVEDFFFGAEAASRFVRFGGGPAENPWCSVCCARPQGNIASSAGVWQAEETRGES